MGTLHVWVARVTFDFFHTAIWRAGQTAMCNAGLVTNIDVSRQHCSLSSFSFFALIEILTLQFVKLGYDGIVDTCNDNVLDGIYSPSWLVLMGSFVMCTFERLTNTNISYSRQQVGNPLRMQVVDKKRWTRWIICTVKCRWSYWSFRTIAHSILSRTWE